MEESCCVPPGFRFHPTEEELVGYYLARKVASQKIDLDIIQEVDLYRIEPWDLQERCRHGGGASGEEQTTTEWYFFSYKDRKYPSGTRTNRATAAGFWKATGRDKPVLSSASSLFRSAAGCSSRPAVIGMRKTLVFYKGRAPNGRKTDWIMHEYRLQSNEHAPAQEEGWVVCRAFQKPVPNQQRPSYLYPTPGYYDNSHFIGGYSAGPADAIGGNIPPQLPPYADDLFESKKHLFSIPPLQSPTAISELTHRSNAISAADGQHDEQGGQMHAPIIDWNFLDSLLLQSTTAYSQLHDDPSSSLQ